MRSRSRILVSCSLALAMACSSEEGVVVTVSGRVFGGPALDEGLAGVRVEIPRSGASTLSGPDGAFRLTTRLLEDPEGSIPVTAVWFFADGLAPAVQAVRFSPPDEATLVARLGQPLQTEEVAIPTGANEALLEQPNGTLRLRKDSLVEESTGAVLEGRTAVSLAVWDASWPPSADHLDAWTIPLPRPSGSEVRLQPLAAAWFDVQPGTPNPDPGVGIEALCRYGDIAFPGISAATRDLYLVDPESGTASRLVEGQVQPGPRILFSAPREGLWVWARPDSSATCVTVTVRRGRHPAPGAALEVWQTSQQGQTIRRIDAAAGAPGGAFCLTAPAGTSLRLDAHLLQGAALVTRSETLLSSGGGSCSTTCPSALEVTFPCLSERDCEDGESCVEGQCLPPPGSPETL